MTSIQIDRAAFIATLGGSEAVATMSDEQRADALDDFLIEQLNSPDYPKRIADHRAEGTSAGTLRRGAGAIFGDGRHPLAELAPMPKHPTLLDFLRLRSNFPMVRHLLQSAEHARRSGGQEILACLLHDLGQLLIRVDHGWWSAQMVEPYVSEEVAFAVRYHQALRFYPDESVGYEYPELCNRIYGRDYVPEPCIAEAAEYARGHRWYLAARMVTVHDLYAFDPDTVVSLDPFADVIGRHFRQPEEGLGFDASPVAHMWRSVIFADHPL